jgi:hypothetical protein
MRFVTQSSGQFASTSAECIFTAICCMSEINAMSDDGPKQVLVKRPSKVNVDDRGRSVWVDPVESAELELVSTQMLKVMLSSHDESDRKAIEKAADTAADGVLARNPSNGQFEIIDDDDLQTILDENQGLPKLTRPADATLEPLRDYVDDEELSLVSTQALRKVLLGDIKDQQEAEETDGKSAGFDPYDSN